MCLMMTWINGHSDTLVSKYGYCLLKQIKINSTVVRSYAIYLAVQKTQLANTVLLLCIQRPIQCSTQ